MDVIYEILYLQGPQMQMHNPLQLQQLHSWL